MLDVIVRSSRDADAVKAMLSRFYPDWSINVYTLHGVRDYSEILGEIKKVRREDRFYVLMLGRSMRDAAVKLDESLPMNIAVHVVPKSKIRNTRIEQLAWELSIAKSMFRLAATWSSRYNSYVFGLRSGVKLRGYEFNPAYDVFLGIGEGFKHYLEKIVGAKLCNNPLIVRKFGGEHDIYCGAIKTAKLYIPDTGVMPHGRMLTSDFDHEANTLDNLLKANDQVLKLYENVSINLLESFTTWADTVVVPWSGGKDSTASLLLTLKVFPREKVKVLFSDTGLEFPETLRYIDEVSEQLNIEVYRVYAGVDKALSEEKLPLPTHSNRWCTGRKINSIDKAVAKLSKGNTLIVTGDRDAESKIRSTRSPIRRLNDETIIVSPLKLWSAAHVQLYVLWRGFKLNPLYTRGFYRIGCYICPALRSWELYIMLNDRELRESLENKPFYIEFIRSRISKGSST